MTVSVVIPAYNAGRFIEEAIASVLSQETVADEIVVVDDGSTDRDYFELERIDGRIRVVRQSNRGVSAARNVGCDVATGTYIAILDADDVWLPGKLQAQMHHLAKVPDTDAVFCRGMLWRPVGSGNEWLRPELPPRAPGWSPEVIELHYPDFLYSIPIATSTMVVRKSVWQEMGGFREGMRYGEDQDFNLRLSFAHRVALLDMPGMLYRQHPNNASSRVEIRNHWADTVKATVKTLGTTDKFGYQADPARLALYLAQIHFQHGYDHFFDGDFGVARREFAQTLRFKPGNTKAAAYMVLCALPGVRAAVRRLRRPASHASQDAGPDHAHWPDRPGESQDQPAAADASPRR